MHLQNWIDAIIYSFPHTPSSRITKITLVFKLIVRIDKTCSYTRNNQGRKYIQNTSVSVEYNRILFINHYIYKNESMNDLLFLFRLSR